ncbi:MAG: Sulphatase-modifying factor protein [Methylobacter sp.]|nr:MAG: Sulphatase-modifying factor protein [Methylobacter sp.]PPD19130.1 MAG: Sulphatase-modifying factor protein [Methylobacter sp.]
MRTYAIYPTEFPEPWASDWGEDEYGLWMGFTYKGVKQLFRWIEPGTFLMGSPEDELEHEDVETQHTVTLSKGFWLAECTVTQALWQAAMGTNPSRFLGDDRPVENVSWYDAQAFIDTLNGLKPELKLCLPTEAQWEYACRAGTRTPFSFGMQIDSNLINFNGYGYPYGKTSKNRAETVTVKSLLPNTWGLYEMHGNVWEWCKDWYGDYPKDDCIDPTGPATGTMRVLRGGSWGDLGGVCRSAIHYFSDPEVASGAFGFRLALGH